MSRGRAAGWKPLPHSGVRTFQTTRSHLNDPNVGGKKKSGRLPRGDHVNHLCQLWSRGGTPSHIESHSHIQPGPQLGILAVSHFTTVPAVIANSTGTARFAGFPFESIPGSISTVAITASGRGLLTFMP